jgi:hypothetical protein
MKKLDYVNKFLQATKHTLFRDNITLVDGSILSIQASEYHYCSPRKNNLSTYKTVEVWLFPEDENFFSEWGGSYESPAAYVPIEEVNKYIHKCGGIL